MKNVELSFIRKKFDLNKIVLFVEDDEKTEAIFWVKH